MSTPFQTQTAPRTPAPRGASKNSVNYLRDLMLDKAAHQGHTREQATAEIEAWLADWPAQNRVSFHIDRLKSEGYTGRKYSFATETAQPQGEIEDGFYVVPGTQLNEPAERIIKIIHAVHDSGRQYGKVLNPETRTWNFLTGAVRLVRAHGEPLTYARACELGKLYGMCIRCGATLTLEESIERGMGSVCASKF